MFETSSFLDYDKFKSTFGSTGIATTLQAAGKAIDNLTQDELLELINIFTKMWPHNIYREYLTAAAKRLVQRRFYEQLYEKQPSQDVLTSDAMFIKRLQLMDNKPDTSLPIKKEITKPPTTPTTPKEPKQKREPKPKKPISEFGQKVVVMDLNQLITWALEIGVPQERIDQHKSKPLGLAKMNISNLIRPKLKLLIDPIDNAAKISIECHRKAEELQSDAASNTKVPGSDNIW